MPNADIASRLIDVARSAAAELRGGAAGDLQVSLDSTLQNDLGLDSLARVELLHRIEDAFQVRLRDEAFASAISLRDLLTAVEGAGPQVAMPRAAATVVATASAPEPAPATAATLIEVLQWHVNRRPSATGIHVVAAEGASTISYAALWARALMLCGALQSRGVVAGDAIALMLPTGADYFTAFMGVLLCGGVPVPIYPPAQPSQLEEHVRRHARLLQNARAVALLTDRSAHRLGRLLQAHVPCLRRVDTVAALVDERHAGEVAKVGTDGLALLQYTSGSTGDPKGVMLTHAQLLANIRIIGRTIRVVDTDLFVSWLPLYHDMGLIGAWLGTLYYGLPLVVMSPLTFLSRPERWLWAIHHHRATLSAAPNFAYELCVNRIRDADLAGLDLSSWRVAFNGAEAVLPETLERFCGRFAPYGFRRAAMTPVYGMAECAVGLAFPPLARGPVIDRVAREIFTRTGAARPAATEESNPLRFVGCGRPLPGYEIRIVDPDRRELGERREGRLEFKGPSATHGYIDNPAATARLLHDGWLDSGDRAYVAGGEIYVTGRTKDIVIRRGRHIHPDELEAAVGTLEGVRKGCVAIFGSRLPDSGTERLVVMAETYASEAERRAALTARITARIIEVLGEPPDEVLLVPPHSVLKTSSGKIRRAASREVYEGAAQRIHRTGPRAVGWQLARLALASLWPVALRLRRSIAGALYAGYFWTVMCGLGVGTGLLVTALPRSWAAAVARTGARGLLLAVGMRVTVQGAHYLPRTGPCVVVANHSSYLDGLVVLGTLGREFRFVAKRELLEQPLARLFLARLGTVFVAREEALESVSSAEAMAAAVRAGDALLVFGEGTFTRAPGLLPFHLGGFLAAAVAGAPTVPMVIRGTRSALRDGQCFPRLGPIAVEFGPAIAAPRDLRPMNAAVQLRNLTRAYIAARCGEPDLGPQAGD